MMKQRKKKNSQQIKQESSQHQKEFYKKMRQIIALVGDASAYNMLGKNDLSAMYLGRLRPFKIVDTNTTPEKLSSKSLKNLNDFLSYKLHSNYITIGEQQASISLYDFTVYVETLHMVWRNAPMSKMKDAEKFMLCFPVFNEDFNDKRDDAHTLIKEILQYIAAIVSYMPTSLVRIEMPSPEKSTDNDLSAFFNNCPIIEKITDTELLDIDGNKRAIYQYYIRTDDGFAPATIIPERLGVEGIMQKFPIKVFIQKHATDRLKERLGEVLYHFNYWFISGALVSEDVIRGENNFTFLFPVTYINIRLGYLKASIIGDKLLIHTFLFLTNNGTPEGKKLQELIGLEKEDKKYLGIDQLATFINSDIKKDEKLKNLFTQAGCGDLFKLNKNVLTNPQEIEISTAEFLKKYLGV